MMAEGSQRGCVGDTHILEILQINCWLGLPFPRMHAEPSSLRSNQPKRPFWNFPSSSRCQASPALAHVAAETILALLFPPAVQCQGKCKVVSELLGGVEEVPEPPETSETPLWSPGLTGKWQLLMCPEQQWPSPVYFLPTRYCNSPVTACNSFKVATQRESLIKQPPSSMILDCNSAIFKEREKADISSAPQRNPQTSIRMYYI